jgi:acetyl esterase/lipase
MNAALQLATVCFLLFAASMGRAAEPTLKDVKYGDDPRQVLDFYRATADKPTPLLFFIHGGGWLNGDKGTFNNTDVYLKAGISVVSIEYRFVTQAAAAGVKPPVKWPLHDAARALQFVRSKRAEWNLDGSRIAASGSSAGACSALWLAFHDDLADPQSADPVARESTRLAFVAVARAQTTLDPQQMKEWIPNGRYGAHAFGFEGDTKAGQSPFEQFVSARPTILPWIREYSPYELVTRDDPPVGLYYNTPPAMGQDQDNPAHSANFGQGLKAKLEQVGVDCEFVYPGAANVRYPQLHQFVIARLQPRNE